MSTGLDEPRVSHMLTELHRRELVAFREGRVAGWSLTAAGRAEHEAEVRHEVHRSGCETEVEKCYGRFLELNGDLLAVATAWQVRQVDGQTVANHHADGGYDAEAVGPLRSLQTD